VPLALASAARFAVAVEVLVADGDACGGGAAVVGEVAGGPVNIGELDRAGAVGFEQAAVEVAPCDAAGDALAAEAERVEAVADGRPTESAAAHAAPAVPAEGVAAALARLPVVRVAVVRGGALGAACELVEARGGGGGVGVAGDGDAVFGDLGAVGIEVEAVVALDAAGQGDVREATQIFVAVAAGLGGEAATCADFLGALSVGVVAVGVVGDQACVAGDARGERGGEGAVAVVEGGEPAVGVKVVPGEAAVGVLGRLQVAALVVEEAVGAAGGVGEPGQLVAVGVAVTGGVVGARAERPGRSDALGQVAFAVVSEGCFGAEGVDRALQPPALVVLARERAAGTEDLCLREAGEDSPLCVVKGSASRPASWIGQPGGILVVPKPNSSKPKADFQVRANSREYFRAQSQSVLLTPSNAQKQNKVALLALGSRHVPRQKATTCVRSEIWQQHTHQAGVERD
jgi:hypothetical protein